RVRKIHHGLGRLTERFVFFVTDYADNPVDRRAIWWAEDFEVFADGTFVREVAFGESVVDDDHAGRVGNRVALVEFAAAKQSRAHQLKIAGSDPVGGGVRRMEMSGLRLVCANKTPANIRTTKRKRNGRGGAFHAGEILHALNRLTEKPAPLLRLCVLRLRQKDIGLKKMLRIEAGIGAREQIKALDQQAGADEQDEGQRDLNSNQRVSRPAAFSCRDSAATFTKRFVQINFGRLPRRREAKEN